MYDATELGTQNPNPPGNGGSNPNGDKGKESAGAEAPELEGGLNALRLNEIPRSFLWGINPHADFKRMLGIIGFDPLAAGKIVKDGYGQMSDLHEVSEEHFVSSFTSLVRKNKKLSFPATAQFKLLVAQFYATSCDRHGNIPIAQEVADTTTYKELRGMYILAKHFKVVGSDGIKLAKFESGTSFVKWRKQAENYLGSIFNTSGIPLAYVIRDEDHTPSQEKIYSIQNQKSIECTGHLGTGFISDNERVWTILQDAILGSTGEAFIRHCNKSKDGRKAWKALNAHYLGAGPISTQKQAAYATIDGAKYTGESARFTFETYVSTLQNAYETLAEFDEAVPEAKKVSDFLKGIHVTNTYVSAAVANVETSADMRANFTSASNYLANTVANHKKTLNRRTVSEFKKGPAKKQGGPKKPKVENRDYSKADWDKLTRDEQDKVRKLRQAAKEAKKRKAAALETDPEDEKADEAAGDAMARKGGKKQK